MISRKNTGISKLASFLTITVMGVAMISLAACSDEKDDGVAAQLGHKLDKLADNQGPAEKAGDKVDSVIKSLKE